MQTPTTSPTDSAGSWVERRRVPLVVAVLIIGLALSLLAAQLTQRAEQMRVWLVFERDASHKVAAIQRTMDESIEQVRSLADFIAVHPDLDAEAFRRYVLPGMERQPQLVGVSWSVVMPHDRIDEFEAAMRAEGDPTFTVHVRDAEGNIQPVGDGPIHVIVKYLAPSTRERAIGFDSYSSPLRRRALEVARDTGQPTATAPVRLAGGEEPELGVTIFVPVYAGGGVPDSVEERRARLLGFATGGLQLQSVVTRALSYLAEPHVRVDLWDVTDITEASDATNAADAQTKPSENAAGEGPPLATFPAHAPPPAEVMPELRLRRVFNVAGRRWEAVARPLPPFFAQEAQPQGWTAPLVFAAGGVITALVAVALWALLRHAALQRAAAIERERINRELQARVAEKENAERALSASNRELQAVNRDMEEFVSAVSHDLKNPIVGVEWMAAALEQSLNTGDADEARKALGNIRQACASMKRIIHDLIEHSRAGLARFDPAPVDLDELVREVLEEARPEIERRSAEVTVRNPLPVVLGERNRFHAVFDNLVGNALKYGASNGQPPRIEIGCTRAERELRLFVRDHGPGIPPTQHEAVFKLFHRLSADQDGTGIGLAIVARVARAHRGRAWVESAPGAGATFFVALPETATVRESCSRV